tara:strand:+ start:318 stop:671 length:354 start_codon:yes stop_codon:yes gene_type:complete
MIDYEIKTINAGYDIVLPLMKVSDYSTLLFNQVSLLLDTYLTEFPYDSTQGIDYDSFLGDSLNLASIRNKYYSKISKLLYFSSMTNFAVNLTENRSLKISFTVTATTAASKVFEQEV